MPIWMYRLSRSTEDEFLLVRHDSQGSWLSGRTDRMLRHYGEANLERSKRHGRLAKTSGSTGDGTNGYYDTTRWDSLDACHDAIGAQRAVPTLVFS